MDEIDDALKRIGCSKARYLLNTHENFDHSSANDYSKGNGAIVIGTEGCWQELKEDGAAKFAEMARRSPELKTRFPDLKMGMPNKNQQLRRLMEVWNNRRARKPAGVDVALSVYFCRIFGQFCRPTHFFSSSRRAQ
jgi:hypothetical protein